MSFWEAHSIFICVSNIGTVLKNIPCVSECVTSSITVPQSSRMTHHLSLNDNPVIIYGHLAILHGPPRHPARPTSPSCTTRHVIMNLFQDLCPNIPLSRADSVPTFAISGHACLRQKSLRNIMACPAPFLKAPLGRHSLITHHCDE